MLGRPFPSQPGIPSRRIAIVCSSYPSAPGDAAGHFIQAEARQLARFGHQVTVLAPAVATGREQHRDSVQDRLTVMRLPPGDAFGWPGALERLRRQPLLGLRVPALFSRMRRTLLGLDVDEVHAHWLLPSLWPVSLGVRAPLLAVAHGSDVHLLRRLPAAVRAALVRQALSKDVRWRFVAHRLQHELLDSLAPKLAHELAARCFVQPCAIDVEGVPGRAAARARLGLSDPFIALSVGRLVVGKHVDIALRRTPLPKHARWVVIGDGPERSRLESTYPEASFLGQLDRTTTLTWIAAADVLVVCSSREGAPTVVREARQLGTPVFANDVGDVAAWAAVDPGIRILRELSPQPEFD